MPLMKVNLWLNGKADIKKRINKQTIKTYKQTNKAYKQTYKQTYKQMNKKYTSWPLMCQTRTLLEASRYANIMQSSS